MKRLKVLAASAVLSIVGLALPAPANAAGSIGVGATCDETMTHCVTTQAFAVGGGASPVGGKVAAVCKAETTGAVLVTVSCTVEGVTATTSLPGANGVAAVVANTSKIVGHEVCWSSTGYFTALVGPAIPVTDQGCAIVTA